MTSNILPLYPTARVEAIKSEGCYIYDANGKKYVDFEAGVWASNVGHCHPRIVAAFERYSKEMLHHGYRFTNPYTNKLAAKLNELTGIANGSSVILSSGSEAVNLSITLAMHLTKRSKIAKISNSYLSAYGHGAISPNNSSVVTAEYNNRASLSKIDFSQVAAVVLETGGASIEMVKIPDNDFVNELLELGKKHGCLTIAEEVTTGMGRMGKWFGYEHYNAAADMVVTGKGLGSGFPISAVTASEVVANQLNADPIRYAQSHQNDPIGAAIALETISIIEEEQLIQRCQAIGEYFYQKLEQLKEKHPYKVKEARGRGLMLALELYKEIDTDSIDRALFEAGYVTGYKNSTFRFLPPLTIPKEDIDQLAAYLEKLLE
jgi:acetylornithine aminotransferase